ncbi:DsrE family protein [Lactococcus garvieae]|uniref:DsrE family protein n=1 Tax=Lactococcus garvieae TaxID=1363 RepID=UPI003852768E
MLQVILHIDENHKWNTLLSNVKNLKEWLTQNKEPGKIEILVNGEAVEMALKTSSVDLAEVLKRDIKVAVCQNSLNMRGYKEEELQEGCTVVPAGIVELVQKQNSGFAYVKP